jgi:hypothetical protein
MAFLAVFSEMSWGLHPWGLVFSATIGEALKGACEIWIGPCARPL